MKHSFIVIAILLLTGCGQGFRSHPTCPSCSSQNESQGQDEPLDLNGKISGGLHDQHQMMSWNSEQKTLRLKLPLISSFINQPVAEKALDSLARSSMAVEIGDDGKTHLILSLPITLFNELPTQWQQSSTLPNQQPLPDFTGESAYFTSLKILGSKALLIYLNRGKIGVFWEASFDPHIAVAYPLLNPSHQELGFFSHIPASENQSGGYFMSFIAPGQLLQQLNIPDSSGN
ncbi:MAG: hypothetical protein KDD33_00785 [Bdellovibrionales bacterium]|nr:hypothetical protein [Bdellovibrionales bacterium]